MYQKTKGQNESWEIWQGFKRSPCPPSLGNHIATVVSMTTAGPRMSALGEWNSGRALNHALLFSILDSTVNGLDFSFMVTYFHTLVKLFNRSTDKTTHLDHVYFSQRLCFILLSQSGFVSEDSSALLCIWSILRFDYQYCTVCLSPERMKCISNWYPQWPERINRGQRVQELSIAEGLKIRQVNTHPSLLFTLVS